MNKNECGNCGFPEKRLWVGLPNHPYPKLVAVPSKPSWIGLKRCSECRELWVEGAYEPFDSYVYAVKWPKDESNFLDTMSKEGEAWLFQWHAAEIRVLASGADSETLAFIEEHYRRTGLDFRPSQTIHKYLFENNTPDQLFAWAKQLRIFRVCRSPGGHLDTVPDAFSARATFRDEASRSQFLSSLGIVFDRDHPVELRGHKVRLQMASRNGWHDIWFNVTSGNSCDYSLTEEDFKIARELDAFFQTLTVKFIEPRDNRNCICPKFFPEAFSVASKGLWNVI